MLDLTAFLRDDSRSRREMMGLVAKSAFGVSLLPFVGAGTASAQSGGRAKRCVYLYMNGAMSHIDTFDPKPKSENQGETGVIGTKVAGVQFGENLPKLAGMANELAVVRSLNTSTGAHEPGRYLMRTNYKKIASTRHPGLGSWLHRMNGKPHRELPATVQIGGGVGPGYLGAKFAPVPIGDPNKGLENTTGPDYITDTAFNRRMQLSAKFDTGFKAKADNAAVRSYDELYGDAIRLLKSKDLAAFDITKEPEAARTAYGDTRLGRGALLARRLLEHGVQWVEVGYGGWDHHQDLWDRLPDMASTLDNVLATLLGDLKQRGMLDDTLVVLATEFGRKPKINQRAGRDHHPAAYSCVLAGGGVKGGQVYGGTDEDGFYADTDPCTPQDFNATIASALGLPLEKEIFSPTGRPFTIANGGTPIASFL